MRRAVVLVAAAVFAAALVHRFHSLGGPYFEFPETVSDHVSRHRFPSTDAILLVRRAEPLLRRGASVTAFQPSLKDQEIAIVLTASGLLPRQHVLWPNLDFHPDYILSVREPFASEKYRLIAEFPEGKVYERIR